MKNMGNDERKRLRYGDVIRARSREESEGSEALLMVIGHDHHAWGRPDLVRLTEAEDGYWDKIDWLAADDEAELVEKA